MFIIEDFRHAPMRPLATAETPEEAARVVSALGIEGHACITAKPDTIAGTMKRVENLDAELSLFRDRATSAEHATSCANTAKKEAEARAEHEVKRAQRDRDDALAHSEKIRGENAALRKKMDVYAENERLRAEIAALRASAGSDALSGSAGSAGSTGSAGSEAA